MVVVEPHLVAEVDVDDPTEVAIVLEKADVDRSLNPNLKGSATAVVWPTTTLTLATFL